MRANDIAQPRLRSRSLESGVQRAASGSWSPAHSRTGSLFQRGSLPGDCRQGLSSKFKASCYTLSCACSVTFLVAGALLVHRSDMSHVSELATLRLHDIIADWNGTFQSEISDTKWVLLMERGEPLEMIKTVGWHSERPGHKPSEDAVHALPDYVSTHFVGTGLLGMAIPWGQDEDTERTPPVPADRRQVTPEMMEMHTLKLQVTNPGGVAQVLKLGEHQLIRSHTALSSSWKTCQHRDGGRWLPAEHKCVMYEYLDSLCYKVQQEVVSGLWALDNTFGGSGCSPHANWASARYHRLTIPNTHTDSLPTIARTQEEATSVSVWHAHDPAVAVSNMTAGSMFHEISGRSADQYLVGVVFMVLGAVCMLPAMGLLGISLLVAEEELKVERLLSTSGGRFAIV